MVKKILKSIMAVIGAVLGIVVIICLCIIINGTCLKSYKNDKDLSNWMSNINDEVLVNEVIIPGSHDAGTYKMNWLGETQQFDIDKQLEMGVRYFDIRVNKTDDGKYLIFHSIINGVEFLPILNSIKEFIIDNPSETLLLDFQHFNGNSQEDVYNFITEYLYDNDLLVVNDTQLTDLQFINQLKMKDTRGKCIIFWGDRSSDLSNYLFLRNNDSCSYDEMCLNSYYDSDYHGKDYNYLTENGYPIYFDNIIDKMTNEGKGIFVLQAQLTDSKLIFGPYSKEKTNSKKISNYINAFKDKEELKYLNVIMRDFIDVNKCIEIINLNYYKNNCSNLIN